VFYDLCADAGGEGEAEHFAYLRGRPGTAKPVRYLNMQAQLQRLEVPEEDIQAIERVLWCILHLGNLDFVDSDSSAGGSSLDPACTETVAQVTDLLGMTSTEEVAALFTTRHLRTGRESVIQPRSATQARDARDALAKDLYSRLFRWIVWRINQSIQHHGVADGASAKRHSTSVSILDIFGFECFESNSFEQLCINYCNERLVQQFNAVLVEAEVVVCRQEGVPMEDIGLEEAYAATQAAKLAVLQGIDKVFNIIQDETRLPRATDATLTVKLLRLQLGQPTKASRMANATEFAITHYAGPVAYNVNGFLEKNKDEGPKDIVEVVDTQSSSDFLKRLFAAGEDRPASSEQDRARDKRSGRGSNNKKSTIGVQFRDEFSALADALSASEQQFVMCVKPNRSSKPKTFDDSLVRRQLECNGLLAVCQVRKSAFASHMPHAAFVAHYRVLAEPGLLVDGPARDQAAKLVDQFLDELVLDDSEVFVGKSRVLLREAGVVSLNVRLRVVTQKVVRIQARVRAFFQQRRFALVKAAACRIQQTTRGHLARRRTASLKRQARAAIVLQSWVRGMSARQLKATLLFERQVARRCEAATTLQGFARGAAAKREVVRLRQLQHAAASAVAIQRMVRGLLGRRQYEQVLAEQIERQMSARTIQRWFRCLKARRARLLEAEEARRRAEFAARKAALTASLDGPTLPVPKSYDPSEVLSARKLGQAQALEEEKGAAALAGEGDSKPSNEGGSHTDSGISGRAQRVAAASAGLAAVLARQAKMQEADDDGQVAAGDRPGEAAQISRAIAGSGAMALSEFAGSATSADIDEYNAALLSRAKISNGRRRPSAIRGRRRTSVASQEAVEGAESAGLKGAVPPTETATILAASLAKEGVELPQDSPTPSGAKLDARSAKPQPLENDAAEIAEAVAAAAAVATTAAVVLDSVEEQPPPELAGLAKAPTTEVNWTKEGGAESDATKPLAGTEEPASAGIRPTDGEDSEGSSHMSAGDQAREPEGLGPENEQERPPDNVLAGHDNNNNMKKDDLEQEEDEDDEEEKNCAEAEHASSTTAPGRLSFSEADVYDRAYLNGSATVLQKYCRRWLAVRLADELRLERQADVVAFASYRRRSRKHSQDSFAYSSAEFELRNAQLEEEFYAGIAQREPEFQFLEVNSQASASPKNRNSASRKQAEEARRLLQNAIASRNFVQLTMALSNAETVNLWDPPLIQRAEAICAQIRKIHIKQIEAERALAIRLGLSYAPTTAPAS